MKQIKTLHAKIFEDIRGKIVNGTWPPGTRLPYEVDLAEDYGCARMTVNKALGELVRMGFVERKRRSGTFVRHPAIETAVLEITDIAAEVDDLGQSYSYQICSRNIRNATPAEESDLYLFGPLLQVQTMHYADGMPFCFEDRLIHLAVVPQAVEAAFDRMPPGSWLLRQVPWSQARHQILAETATEGVAEQLEIPSGGAVLVMVRDTEWAGKSVTHVRLCYPGARHHLTASFSS